MKRLICILILICFASAFKTKVKLDSLDKESIKFIKTSLDPAQYSKKQRESILIEFVLNQSETPHSERQEAIEANKFNNLVLNYYLEKQFYSEFLKYLFCFATTVEEGNWRKSTEPCRTSVHFSAIDSDFLMKEEQVKMAKVPFISIKGSFSETTSNFINIVLLEDFKDYIKKDFIDFLPIMMKKALMKAKWSLAVVRLVLHSATERRDKIFERIQEIESLKEDFNQIEDLREDRIEMLGAIKQKIIHKNKEKNLAKDEQMEQIIQQQIEALEMYRNRLLVDIEGLKRKIKDNEGNRDDLNRELLEANEKVKEAVKLFVDQTLLYSGAKDKVNAMEEDVQTVLNKIKSNKKPKKSWFFKWFSRNTDCFKLCGGQ